MENRREFRRYLVAIVAEVDQDGDVFEGETRDVSMGGVSAILSAPLTEGGVVDLALILTQDGIEDAREDPFETRATVMWVAPTDAGGHMTGLRFAELNGPQSNQLQRFLAEMADNG